MEKYKIADEKIVSGYRHIKNGEVEEACDAWLDAWEDIKAIIDCAEKEVSCENSSIYRIKRWFKETSRYIAGCIAAIAAQRGLATDAASYPVLQSIKSYVGKEQGWLARAVRTMVNTNNWIHTRSAFMT